MSRDTNTRLQKLNQQIHAAQKHIAALDIALYQNNQLLDQLQANNDLHHSLSQILEHVLNIEKIGEGGVLWGDCFNPDQVKQFIQRLATVTNDYNEQLITAHQQRDTLLKDHYTLVSETKDLQEQQVYLQDKLYDELSEFSIERKITPRPIRRTTLPWSDQPGDAIRSKTSIVAALFLTISAVYLFNKWEVPKTERIDHVKIPARIAMLIMTRPEPAPEPVPEKKPEEEIEKKNIPEDKPEHQDEKIKAASKTARKAGILAFKRDFMDMMDASSDIKLGSQATISTDAGSQYNADNKRSLVTSQIQLSAAGTTTRATRRADASTDNNLKTITFSRIESTIAADADSQADFNKNATAVGPSPDDDARLPPGQSTEKSVRTDEEIQIVFDRYKDALYRIYNRELRKNAMLKGKLILRITIEPSGKVTRCILDSSNLNAPELENKIIARVLKFNFGQKPAATVLTILYPIDFLPAS